ncbi:MAG: carbohydrate ABC transporter permease [Chloroflexi bacterium]|nr:carbohydrate ABC transporter permease [Chloroflexota bacterium]MCC6894092.1 carbohydrate ABC transporter permease [Anaerolineae bacterium]
MDASNPSNSAFDGQMGIRGQNLLVKSITTLILAGGAVFILIPLAYMISISLRDRAQIRQATLDLIPSREITVTIDGKEEPLYTVTIDGVEQQMALVKNRPGGKGIFVEVNNPEITHELVIAEQTPIREVSIHPENYPESLTAVPFDRYLLNTILVTFFGMVGMLFSCSLVAYGFSRFRARWLNILFLLLLSTIMLPRQVTLIPVYILFQKIGWVDTLLPLIVPQFFANAYDVFLLRQFFMTIPLELDDAAKLDGASTFQTLLYIILPMARPALVSVAIFHFLYAWNDFYEPLIFLHSRENWTMAVGLQTFNAVYSVNTHLVMAASAVMIIPPIILFFLSQKVFTQGVVVTRMSEK